MKHDFIPDSESERALRRAALRIFGTAVLACAVLFALVSWLTVKTSSMILALLLVGGIIGILWTSLVLWQRISERRIENLITRLRSVELSRDEAEVAREEHERMLAAMSHEIRTPLNGVIGMLNLMLATPLSAEQKNYAKTAQASGRTLLSIIEEILDTAKGRAFQASGEQATHIRQTVENVTELLAARAHAKSIEISSYVAPGVPEKIAIDDTCLRQILFNVAGNAIKFTEHGGVAIDITWADNQLQIAVKDSGIGMAAEEVNRVFIDFQQANRTTARRFGGTGLGLGITKRLLTRLGGTIDVVSEPGQGTTVTLGLPLPGVSGDLSGRAQPLSGLRFDLGISPGVTEKHLAQMLRDEGASVNAVDAATALLGQNQDGCPILIIDTAFAKPLRQWARSRKEKSARPPQVWTIVSPEERQSNADLLGRPFAGYLLKPVRPKSLLTLLSGVDDAGIDEAVNQLRAVAARSRPFQPLAVLLADDNPVNLLLTRTMLTKAGHTVTTAQNGAQVLQFCSQQRFDILLLDVDMPVMDGYETARCLRSNEHRGMTHPHLPILGLTAHMRQQELDHCIASGMNDYLSKPFDHHDLIEAMERLWRQSAA